MSSSRSFTLLLILLLAGCSGQYAPSPVATPVALPGVLPAANVIAGWTPTGEAQVYHRENLYDLVDGQAESFFAYGFEQVATQKYRNATGVVMRVELWQLATPADAYGLFTTRRSGVPTAIGNEGDSEPGRRLSFWQNRYCAHVSANQELPDADVLAFAQAIAAALPTGGERPALVNRLPTTEKEGDVFFHEEISIQSELWLGGENILGLSSDTQGVMARYNLGGATARLLLIQYPSADKAAAGLAALKSSQVKDLVKAEARDNLLCAVFGRAGDAAAQTLLAEVLQ